MRNDSLYRISFKCFIQDEQGRVLVVKELGRESWDLPGGGIDHGETIKASIERELKEEVAYGDGFSYDVLTVDEPVKLLTREVWQMRVVVRVHPKNMDFGVGEEADAIQFVNPAELKDSVHESERKVYEYAMLSSELLHPS